MNRHGRDPAVGVAQPMMAAFDAGIDETGPRKRRDDFGARQPRQPGSCRHGHALNTDELKDRTCSSIVIFEAYGNRLLNALDQFIERARLRMAASERGNRRNVIPVLVALDDDSEIALRAALVVHLCQLSRNERSLRDLDGCFSFLSALASI